MFDFIAYTTHAFILRHILHSARICRFPRRDMHFSRLNSTSSRGHAEQARVKERPHNSHLWNVCTTCYIVTSPLVFLTIVDWATRNLLALLRHLHWQTLYSRDTPPPSHACIHGNNIYSKSFHTGRNAFMFHRRTRRAIIVVTVP